MSEPRLDLLNDDGYQMQVYESKKLQRLHMMLHTAQTAFGDDMVSKVSALVSTTHFFFCLDY